MNEVLARLCETLGVYPDPVQHTPSTDSVMSTRRKHLSNVARELGRFCSCLSLACSAAACGDWAQAWEWCSFARDIAYDNVSVSTEPRLQGACGAEALRLGAMCLACGGDIDTGQFYLRSLKNDLLSWADNSLEMGAATNSFIEYASTIIELCSGNLDAARKTLLNCANSLNILESIQTMSGREKHQMTGVAYWQLHSILRVLEEENVGNGRIIEKRLIETAIRIQQNSNLWGRCCHLLNVANFYYKWRMLDSAKMALADCLSESQHYGIRVCEYIAQQNMRTMQGKFLVLSKIWN